MEARNTNRIEAANTATAVLCYRPENKNFDADNIISVAIEVSSDWSLSEILATAIANVAVPKGSARSGVFQVQTVEGIFAHVNERKIDLSSDRKAAKVLFASWAAMAAFENANPLSEVDAFDAVAKGL